ncbi:nudix hydrolase 3-like [Diadema setosum]|uniref:nudix hydrolase 3-like n=1 Tax=Diadema setosum TaxID=31175 RepID=UPI003B3A9925
MWSYPSHLNFCVRGISRGHARHRLHHLACRTSSQLYCCHGTLPKCEQNNERRLTVLAQMSAPIASSCHHYQRHPNSLSHIAFKNSLNDSHVCSMHHDSTRAIAECNIYNGCRLQTSARESRHTAERASRRTLHGQHSLMANDNLVSPGSGPHLVPNTAGSDSHKREATTLHGMAMGMTGSKSLTLLDAFSAENRERVMTHLSSKRTLRRFYTKDVRQRGAVLVPLCSINREPAILFTLRTRTLREHSGEVSFPGGKMDPSDGNVCFTALREMQEELGVDPDTVEVWGHLSPVGREVMYFMSCVLGVKTLTVVPVIGYLGEIDIETLKLNPEEVSSVFVMTLSHLCSRASQAYTTFEPHKPSGAPTAILPVFVGGEHRVWGLTAYILDIALQAIVPDHYSSLIAEVKKEQMAS